MVAATLISRKRSTRKNNRAMRASYFVNPL
jgi:hypothetical protein